MPNRGPSYSDGIQMVQMLQWLEDSANRQLRIDAIAARMEVHRRTVIRYVDALNGAVDNEYGEAIVERVGTGEGAVARLGRRVQPLSARIFQFAAIYAATRSLHTGGGSVLSDSTEPLLAEMEGRFDLALKPVARRVHDAFHYVPFGPKDYRANEDALDAVVQGALYRHPVTVEYRTSDGWKLSKTIRPFTVLMYRDGLYVLAQQDGKRGNEMRLYAVDRIREATMHRDQDFRIPSRFSAQEFFSGSLGLWRTEQRAQRIRIAFDDEVVDAVKERQWPGVQGWTEHDDGRGVLELKIPVTPEVVTWIVAWGAMAEVVHPKTLRRRVKGVLVEALANYR
jgi:predicted DNA-binding transcriptional regulator YafY